MEIFTSLLDESLEAWRLVRRDLIDELENIPADQIDFRPVPEMRSVKRVVQHVLEVALMMTGELTRPDTDFRREAWPELLRSYAAHIGQANSKEQLLELLSSSIAESERQFRKFGEVMMLQLVTRFDGKEGTKLAWLHHGISHESYHTGQLTAYERQLGLVPALTQKIGF